MACNCCGRSFKSSSSIATRLTYALLFFVSNIIAWILRDHMPLELAKHLPLSDNCGIVDGTTISECQKKTYVLRVTLANTIFFSLLGACLVGIKTSKEGRAMIQNGLWPVKFILWLGIQVGCFFIPVGAPFQTYATISIFGGALFIVVQLVLLLDFAYAWNESWASKGENKWYAAILGCTGGFYLAAVGLVVGAYIMFPNSQDGNDCAVSTVVTTTTWLLALVCSAISMHPRVEHGAILPSSLISMYLCYYSFSALNSQANKCNPHFSDDTTQDPSWSTFVALGLTFVAITYSALSTGSKTKGVDSQTDAEDYHRLESVQPAINGEGAMTEDSQSPGPQQVGIPPFVLAH
jgi:hypothetical protein